MQIAMNARLIMKSFGAVVLAGLIILMGAVMFLRDYGLDWPKPRRSPQDFLHFVQQEIDPSTANRLVKEASKCIGDASKLSSSTDTFYFPPEKDVATASKLGGEVRVSRVGPDAPYLIFDCLVVPYGIHEYYVYVRVKPGGGLSNDGTTSRVSDEIVLTVKKRAG